LTSVLNIKVIGQKLKVTWVLCFCLYDTSVTADSTRPWARFDDRF